MPVELFAEQYALISLVYGKYCFRKSEPFLIAQ